MGSRLTPGPSVHLRIEFGPGRAIGSGKIALLEQIGRDGSLSQAARDLKMSYRRAWDLLESLNSIFSDPVAVSATGGRGHGGTKLTPFGLELIRLYRTFDAEIQARAAQHFGRIGAGFRKKVSKVRTAATAPIVRHNAR